jgi:hypothetical protein
MTTALTAPAPTTRVPSDRTEVAVLPGDPPVKAIVKISPQGVMKNMLVRVPIDPAQGEAYQMSVYDPTQPKGQQYPKRWVVTALGYDVCNRIVGVSFVAPETLKLDDGSIRPNPSWIRHAKTNELLAIRVRRIGIGRNAQGNLVAEDLTVTYDVSLYLAQDLYSKWTGRKSDNTKEWGKLHPNEAIPTLKLNEKAFPVPGGVTLVVDITHKDVVHIIGEHINRQKFAERNAVTICRRNILKRFIPVTRLDESKRVPCIGWAQTDRDMGGLARAASEANEGRIMYDGQPVEVSRAMETVSDPEDIEAAVCGEAEQAATPSDAEPIGTAVAPMVETLGEEVILKHRARIRQLAARLEEQAVTEALLPVGFKTIEEAMKSDTIGFLEGAIDALEKAELAAVEAKKAAATKAKPKTAAKK